MAVTIKFKRGTTQAVTNYKDAVSGEPVFDYEAGKLFVSMGEGDNLVPVDGVHVNDIGTTGGIGFGVGICPTNLIPTNMSAMAGTYELMNDNYGNYQYQDGSIVCYVPIHWMKVGTGSNGFGVNEISVMKYSTYADETAANAAGYFLPRCFIDGGTTHLGYFVDKYQSSKNAWGTGHIASSIKNGLPLSTYSAHNPISELTACTGNYYYEAITAAHARDGVDGAVNGSTAWFCCSRFIYVNLAMLATAHGQAAQATPNCAWYDGTGVTNFPKGCNDNALGDVNDGTISYLTDGYSNCGLTGSGTPFAKTTHNGQNCGVADLNGNMYEISTGVTCVAATKSIEDITRSNPANVTITAHGYTTGNYAQIMSVVDNDWELIDDKIYQITVIDANNFTIDNLNTSTFDAYWVQGTHGGTVTVGNFYVADEATSMSDFTSGNSGATDHWGATGVAAMMTEFTPVFDSVYPNNAFAQRMGSGANQVLSEDLTGNGAVLRSIGMPTDEDGIDVTGSNLFGKDYYYQYIRNELCVRSGGSWGSTAGAGVWHVRWSNGRTDSGSNVSFRAASLL